MSGSYKPGPFTVNSAGEALDMYARVRINDSQNAVEADEGERADGFVDQDYDSGDLVTVIPFHEVGTCLVIAAGAIAAGEEIYQADNGEVNDIGNGPVIGRTLESASASGDLIEALVYEMAAPERDENDLVVLEEDFLASSYSLSTPPTGFASIDTSSSGTPTIGQSADAHGGAVELQFDSTDETQAIGLDLGNELLFDIDHLVDAAFRFRAPTLNANDEIVIGLISDQNDDPTSITEGVWASVDGAQDIHVESDDGTNRNDDLDSGVDLGNDVWADLYLDFSDLTDVGVYVDVDDSGLALQSSGTTIDVSNYSSGLQPILMLTKSGGTHTTNLDVDYLRVRAHRA